MSPDISLESTKEMPLVFVGRLEESDILCMQWYGSRVLWRSVLRYIIAVTFAILGLLGFLIKEVRLVCISTAIAISILIIVGPICDRCFIVWRYRRRVADYLQTTLTLTEERIDILNDAFHYNGRWNLIAAVAETREGILFLTGKLQPYIWLPERVLGENSRRRINEFLMLNKVRIHKF